MANTWSDLWEDPAPQFPEPLLNHWLVTSQKRPSVWAAGDLDLVITAIASQWANKLSPLSIAFVNRAELNARGLDVKQVRENVPGVPAAETLHFEIPVDDESQVREVLTIIHAHGPPLSLTKTEVVRAAVRILDRGLVIPEQCKSALRNALEKHRESAAHLSLRPETPAAPQE